MAETNNLKLALPTSNEYVDVEVLNENFRKIDTSVLLALAAAAPYSAAATYAVGAYCTKDGKLYRCTVAIPQAEAWNAAHWTATTMGAELVAIYTTLANKANSTHAAQHAKGGADPITPESIGAAPGGYGLGSEPSQFLEANDCVVNGWYRDANGNAKNAPWNYAHIFVTTYSAHIFIRQDAYITGGSTSAPSVSHAVRIRHPDFLKENDFWGPWEYESGTPMYLSVEYRTTERYLGKPVYTIAFDFGALPASGYKILYAPAAANISDIVAYGGCTSGGTAFPCLTAEGCSNGVSPHDIRCAAVKNVSGGIAVSIGVSKDRSAETATVWAKYTKTTE